MKMLLPIFFQQEISQLLLKANISLMHHTGDTRLEEVQRDQRKTSKIKDTTLD